MLVVDYLSIRLLQYISSDPSHYHGNFRTIWDIHHQSIRDTFILARFYTVTFFLFNTLIFPYDSSSSLFLLSPLRFVYGSNVLIVRGIKQHPQWEETRYCQGWRDVVCSYVQQIFDIYLSTVTTSCYMIYVCYTSHHMIVFLCFYPPSQSIHYFTTLFVIHCVLSIIYHVLYMYSMS